MQISVPIRAELVPILEWITSRFDPRITALPAGVEAVMQGGGRGDVGLGLGRASILFSRADSAPGPTPLFRGGVHRGEGS